ncbi:helix-turn-helix domain-containing protein [Martelella lutilitoris]
MALLRENDVLFAYKALNLIPGLPEASRRVAGAILDHFNKKDGQCDPGIERLSRMLGLNRSTVIRATEKLDELGLIEKDSHGGKAHRASYKPNWAYFRAIVEDFQLDGGPDCRARTGRRDRHHGVSDQSRCHERLPQA